MIDELEYVLEDESFDAVESVITRPARVKKDCRMKMDRRSFNLGLLDRHESTADIDD